MCFDVIFITILLINFELFCNLFINVYLINYY